MKAFKMGNELSDNPHLTITGKTLTSNFPINLNTYAWVSVDNQYVPIGVLTSGYFSINFFEMSG